MPLSQEPRFAIGEQPGSRGSVVKVHRERNAPLVVERDRRGRAEGAQWSPSVPESQSMIRSGFLSSSFSKCLSNIGTTSALDIQQIADQRHAISAFCVGLALKCKQTAPQVVRPAGISS